MPLALLCVAERGAPRAAHALQEPLLNEAVAELQSQFPKLQFRKARETAPGSANFARVRPLTPVRPQVGVNLGTPGAYLKVIADATEDIDVTLLFNNAGFMVTGFFDKTCARWRCLARPRSVRGG
jgi:hypothetical protein